MIKPVDPDEKVRYVAIEDQDNPEEQQTVWLLRPLHAKVLAKLENNLAEGMPRRKGGALKFKSGTHVLDTLDKGLAGVENFGDIRIDFEGMTQKEERAARDGFYDKIPPHIRRELADVITGESELDEDEVKN